MTQGKDQTQSVSLFIPMKLQHKQIKIKNAKLSNIMKSNWKGNEKKKYRASELANILLETDDDISDD